MTDFERNKFKPGHPDAIVPFQTTPKPSFRPFTPPTHSEMPCAGPFNNLHLRRRIQNSGLSPVELEAAAWGLSLLNPSAASQFRTAAKRLGAL